MDYINNSALIGSIESNQTCIQVINLTVEKYQNDTMDLITLPIGSTVEYKILVTNNGTSTVINQEFIDMLDSRLEFVNDSFKLNGAQLSNDSYDEATHTLSTILYSIQSGETSTITFEAVIIG